MDTLLLENFDENSAVHSLLVHDKYIYLTDEFNGLLSAYDFQGTLQWQIDGLRYPRGLAIEGDTLFVCEAYSHKIHRYTFMGEELDLFDKDANFAEPSAIIALDEGQYAVVEAALSRVNVYCDLGNPVATISRQFADFDKVLSLLKIPSIPYGQVQLSMKPPEIAGPKGITISDHYIWLITTKNIILLDKGGHYIERFDLDGRAVYRGLISFGDSLLFLDENSGQVQACAANGTISTVCSEDNVQAIGESSDGRLYILSEGKLRSLDFSEQQENELAGNEKERTSTIELVTSQQKKEFGYPDSDNETFVLGLLEKALELVEKISTDRLLLKEAGLLKWRLNFVKLNKNYPAGKKLEGNSQILFDQLINAFEMINVCLDETISKNSKFTELTNRIYNILEAWRQGILKNVDQFTNINSREEEDTIDALNKEHVQHGISFLIAHHLCTAITTIISRQELFTDEKSSEFDTLTEEWLALGHKLDNEEVSEYLNKLIDYIEVSEKWDLVALKEVNRALDLIRSFWEIICSREYLQQQHKINIPYPFPAIIPALTSLCRHLNLNQHLQRLGKLQADGKLITPLEPMTFRKTRFVQQAFATKSEDVFRTRMKSAIEHEEISDVLAAQLSWIAGDREGSLMYLDKSERTKVFHNFYSALSKKNSDFNPQFAKFYLFGWEQEKALEAAGIKYKLNPSRNNSIQLFQALCANGRKSEAKRQLDSFTERFATNIVDFTLSRLFMDYDQLDLVVDGLTNIAVNSVSHDLPLTYRTIKTIANAGAFDHADELCRRFDSLWPETSLFNLWRLELLAQFPNKRMEAHSSINSFIKANGESLYLLKLLRLSCVHKDLYERLDAVQQRIEKYQTLDDDVDLIRARIGFLNNENDAVQGYLDNVDDSSYHSTTRAVLQGQLYYKKMQFDKMLEYLRPLQTKHLYNQQIFANFMLSLARNNVKDSIILFSKHFPLERVYCDDLLWIMAICLSQIGKFDHAKRLFRQMILATIETPRAVFLSTHYSYLIRLQCTDQDRKFHAFLAKLYPDIAVTNFIRLAIAENELRKPEAFQRIPDLKMSHAYIKARTLLRQNNAVEAIEILESVKDTFLFNDEIYLTLAKAYSKTGQQEKAAKTLDQIKGLSEKDFRLLSLKLKTT